MTYLPLRDYALIGDMRTAALISRQGSIDWCCLPRFDSPSVFARVLDADRGGFWSVLPECPHESTQRYEEGTTILETRFDCGEGQLLLTDFMPALEWNRQLSSHQEIHRRVEARGGSVPVEVRFRPRFDYASASAAFERRRYGVLAGPEGEATVALAGDADLTWEIDEATAEAVTRFELGAGEVRWLILRHGDDDVLPRDRYESNRKLRRTRALWREWIGDIPYEGEYWSLVERSALTLKLLCYAPTGAVVAAPTTSLPSEIGGCRNWDFRNSWLRDSTYTMFGLFALGKFEELDRYMGFLKKACQGRARPVRGVYGLRGEHDLPERELSGLAGYRGSVPVRSGVASPDLFQLDVYGEFLDSVHIWRRKYEMTDGLWALCRELVDEVIDNWKRPDAGVWRSAEPRQFVFSKVMCWVALDRAVRTVEELNLDGDVERWRRCRDEIKEEVLARGWNEDRQAFTQHYETDRMDAANLLLPILRFLPHDDPRVLSNVDQIVAELGEASDLLYRYRTPDGMPGSDAAVCLNTFHLSQTLALTGQRDRAAEVFERMIRYASPLGLFSEQIDPESGELLGNYPQASCHVGLINAAHVLARTRPRRVADYALLGDDDTA